MYDMKKLLCLSTAFLMLAAVSCDNCKNPDRTPVAKAKPIELTTRQAEKAAGDNAFAFNLFREVANSTAGKNAFISPLSVTMALGMLYNGTSPDAGAEMAAALGMTGFTETEINEYYQKMRQALLSVDPLTAISIANSIWSRTGFNAKQDFINTNKTYYDAEVRSLDFGLKSSVDAINNWCADKTRDKIKTILDEIPGNAVMYLINAVYFKSKWVMEFDKKYTKEEDFTLAGGAKKRVPMMNQTATLPYYANSTVECLELPYGNGAFSMLVMLPPADKDLYDFVEWLDADAYGDILAGLHEREVRVKLPRFKQECKFSLVEPVADLGMNMIFGNGSLTGIADDPRLAVSDIKHKTFVEVNEEGTEAAAVTAVEIVYTSYPGSILTFYADRPFIYLIREKSTGAILFIGRMDDPQS